MNNIWISSDLHAWHAAVMKFCPDTRRGDDATEMTELMLEKFNSMVKPEDDLYLVGDVSFGGKTKIESFISRLNGRKHLILGNHDYVIRRQQHLRSYFVRVDERRSVSLGDHRFVMSHEPKAEWADCHKGVIHLHGHLHGNKTNVGYQQRFKIMDVGIDAREDDEMAPFHLDEVLAYVRDKEVMPHHDHVDV